MKKKWNRSLGTSKREQGIETPKSPAQGSIKFKQIIGLHGAKHTLGAFSSKVSR